jgi:hypothetical protein
MIKILVLNQAGPKTASHATISPNIIPTATALQRGAAG